MKLKYSKNTTIKLTGQEEELVIGYLEKSWPDALGHPVFADEGYNLHISGNELTIGRAGMYERLSLKHLEECRDDKGKLRGLYFPGATPSFELLCQATLYFDEFFIIHPGGSILSSWNRRHPYGEPDKVKALEYSKKLRQFENRLSAFDASVLELKREGYLFSVPPQMQNHPNFLHMIVSDLGDLEFERIASRFWNSPVFVAAEKMEPLLPLVGDGKDIGTVRKELEYRANYDNWDNNEPPNLFNARHYGMKEVSPILGATILLNHALLLSEKYNLIPFTDDEICQRLMQCKLNRISKDKEFINYKQRLGLGSSNLAIRVLEEYLPRFRFEHISDALEARERLKGELEAFREAMQCFASEIEESPFEHKFLEKVEKTISIRVKPAVRDLENRIAKSKDSFIQNCFKNVKGGSLPIVASIFAGLPAEGVLAISAGIITFGAAIETYRDIRRTKNNGLTLLLGIK